VFRIKALPSTIDDGRFKSNVASWKTRLATLVALATCETLDIRLRGYRSRRCSQASASNYGAKGCA
jgi:hypothetical protein